MRNRIKIRETMSRIPVNRKKSHFTLRGGLWIAEISLILVLAAAGIFGLSSASAAEMLLVEAESFEEYGGWLLDPQFMDQMGSPFLLAHGLGNPAADAKTNVEFPAKGTYRVWVRTRDWVGPWKNPKLPKPQQAEGSPGIFQVLVNGNPLPPTFGESGADWHWQDGGMVEIENAKAAVALRDLTGFEGRCDAVLFCRDPKFTPPNDLAVLAEFRREALQLQREPVDGGRYDLVVIGGGLSGSAAAVTAARLGLSVALIQDRPVLGGNNSAEITVPIQGKTCLEPYPKVGLVLRELNIGIRHNLTSVRGDKEKDRIAVVTNEKNIRLFLNQRANGVEMHDGRIAAVIAQDTGSGRRYRYGSPLFADCTGDASIGVLANADFKMDIPHMGNSNIWLDEDTGSPCAFPRCSWALDLTAVQWGPFGRREKYKAWVPGKKLQFGGMDCDAWESGFNQDPIKDAEAIRDWNFRAIYGAWDTIKNVDKSVPNHRLAWVAHIAGKRESRRLLGDVYLTTEDVVKRKHFNDGCVPLTFAMDIHMPANLGKDFKGAEFLSRFGHTDPSTPLGALLKQHPGITDRNGGLKENPFWLPYRCLYSRNVPNLFMAGRNISVDLSVFGAARVMGTTGMMGEIVGMAASLCKMHKTLPRAVHQQHPDELKELMKRGAVKQ